MRDKALDKLISLTDEKEVSEKLEQVVFDFTNDFCKSNNIPCNFTNEYYKDQYLENLRFIYENLNKKSYIKNNRLLKQILDKKIHINHNLFDYKKIFNKKWKKWEKDLEILNKEIADLNPEVSTTTQFTCVKCKRNTKCSYFQMQTRSSDEPMTNFITCLECGNNWRE